MSFKQGLHHAGKQMGAQGLKGIDHTGEIWAYRVDIGTKFSETLRGIGADRGNFWLHWHGAEIGAEGNPFG